MSAPRKPVIPVGSRFGNLVVIENRRKPKSNGYAEPQSLCLCDCGRSKWVADGRLREGKRIACKGCTARISWITAMRLPATELYLRRALNSYRHGARKRNLPWELCKDHFDFLMLGDCQYCGKNPAKGVDRKDNSKGYTLENATSCCAQCNYAKRDQTEFEFLDWVARIAAKQGFSL